MSDRKVKVESMVNYCVVLSQPYAHFDRVFNKDGQSALIDFDIMEEGLQLTGFRKFFENGTLHICDKKDIIDLGLESEDTDDEIGEIYAISTGEIIKLFKSRDYKAIREAISKASDSTIQNMISTAIKFKLTDSEIVDALQDRCPSNVEIYSLIKLAKDAAKPVVEKDEDED